MTKAGPLGQSWIYFDGQMISDNHIGTIIGRSIVNQNNCSVQPLFFHASCLEIPR